MTGVFLAETKAPLNPLSITVSEAVSTILPLATFVCPNMCAAVDSPLQKDDSIVMDVGEGTIVTALRMRFPADREFVFVVETEGVLEVSSQCASQNNCPGTCKLQFLRWSSLGTWTIM